jgi:hypothetical protein
VLPHLDKRAKQLEQIELIKKGIWLYFLLLLFEGALRKWFLPGLATPLLIIRDPLAITLIVLAWKIGKLPSNLFIIMMAIIGVIGIYTAFFIGHGNLTVALYGARIMLFQFPLIFVIGEIFNREDVIKMGKVITWIVTPMTVLIALQFFSPQSAWVNRGVGGSLEGAGFSGAMGFLRPPATFSFTNGTTSFYSLAACFIFYFWLNPTGMNRLILISATACLIAAIPLSISRGLLFSITVSLIFAAMAVSRKSRHASRFILAGIIIFVALLAFNQTEFFKTATGAFMERFEIANGMEGGLEGVLLDRYLGGLIGALSEAADHPFFGYGLGMGTNVGSMLLTGETSYLISEGEWGRLIGELGPVMGLGIIFIRLALSFELMRVSYQRLVKGDLLPWLLVSFGLLNIPQGQWAQPTALGFCILIGGLIFSSMKSVRRGIPKPDPQHLKSYEHRILY